MRNRRKLKKVYYQLRYCHDGSSPSFHRESNFLIWIGLITIGRHSFLSINQTITLKFALDYTIRFSLALREQVFDKTACVGLVDHHFLK